MSLELNSTNVEYKNNKVIIKNIPQNGENLSVFIRPGDEVVFDIKGINSDALEYVLVGGDIVISFPGEGALTFPSLGLMSFSSNPPQLNFGGNKVSVENILSKIEEINELPITSVDASFKVRVSDTDEDRGLMHDKSDKAPPAPVIIVPQSQTLTDAHEKEDFIQTRQEDKKSYESQTEVIAKSNTVASIYTKPYSHYTKPNDFDAYKPDVEMIPKPDVEMIPKPDVEMIPKPDVEMMPVNDFTDYFPENDFTGYGNGNGDGNGDGNVSGAAKPVFYFKATEHQVRYSEIINEDNKTEILGGGGSINGYKFDSITNQFEPETIDMSARTEDMVIRTENTTYFSDVQASLTGIKDLTFGNLISGQSVTVDGLTLTASGDIAAADVAAGFASLTASASSGNAVTNGTWSGALSTGWSSATKTDATVTFNSTETNNDISAFSITSSGSTIADPSSVTTVPTQGITATTTEIHALTFQNLAAGQSVTVDGLKLTASNAIAAADVAAGFASLTASASSGNAVTNGTWSGALSTGWSSAAKTDATVTFTSETVNSDVTDIVVTVAGSTIADPTSVDIIATEERVDVYLSKVLRFEPQMPEGFYVDSFSIGGLPSGVTILDENASPIAGSDITREDMIFKDALGEVIAFDSVDFLTNFKSVEFTVKYLNTIADPFNVSITANYKLDASYADTTDIEPEQSYTNEYTFALKDITAASDYTYNKNDFADAKAEGFILSKETNYNIIKDGSGNSTIYGGIVKDVVYDGAGDDTLYLSAGDDTIYGGSGTNRIYGDTNNDSIEAKEYAGKDSISYENVRSFTLSEVELLNQEGLISSEENQKLSDTYEGTTTLEIDMLASFNGVYVDLDGVYIDGLNIDVNSDGIIDANDKINAISKFAANDGRFTYDDNGYAIATSLGKSITFTSITPNTEVADIVITSTGITAVGAPTALDLASTQGVAATTTELHAITFKDLIAGQSVTVDGLKLTATADISATAVASAFASLTASAVSGNAVANGTWSGSLSAGWSSGTITGADIIFTSTTAATDVGDIVATSAGIIGVDDPTATESVITQGSAQSDTKQTEKTTLVFKDLIAGQSVTVDGLTLTANGAISATAVAAGFASLAAGATAGNIVSDGVWSGALANYASGTLEKGLENIQATGYDIYEDIENITGSSYNDTIYGNAAKDNILSGLGGSDTIDARGGDNRLLGGDGFDTLIAGSGEDFIDGGADTDTVSYANMSEGITIRFDRPNAEEYDYSGRVVAGDFVIKDKIINTEDIIGSEYDDTVYGNSNTNFIQGGSGDDKVYAGGGYDFIDGGAGSDWITYKPSDYVASSTNPNFMQQIEGITVDLNSSDFVMVKETTTNKLIDLIKSVEEISATDGIDKIYGNNVAEEFWGHGGADTLYGRGGNDILHGGSGDDYIRPGSGVDESHGDAGVDYIELYDDGLKDKSAQTLRLDSDGEIQRSTDTTDGVNGTWSDGYLSGGGAGTVELADGFEGIGGSSGADKIYGNDIANVINGNQGNDDLYGMGGNDTIRGSTGADTIYGGIGADIIYGDQDNDIIAAGDGDDTVYGYGKYDTATNNDTIDGGDGRDTLNYSLTPAVSAITLDMAVVDVNGYATVVSSSGATYNDLVKGFESIIGSTGNDTITADSTGITLDGWSGTDKLYGGSGDDTIIARNTSTEILNGNDGDDLLKLAQNVDFRTMTVQNFESLEIGDYSAYFNIAQFFTNNTFSEITGGTNGKIYLYATNTTTNDTFDFSNIDFTNFSSSSLYVYGYNGNDTYDFSDSTLNDSIKFYLDAGGGTDTLVMGDDQNISMLDNYYNTFETFDIGADSNLNINAYNDSGRTFYAHNKDFSNVDGDVNLIGGKGNDTFYADFDALLTGKLNIEGGNGTDIVDVRTTQTNSAFAFDDNDAEIFNNIERLELDTISNTNTVSIDATVMDDWISGGNITLDLANNNTQSSKVTVTDTQVGDMTNFIISSSDYTITPVDNDSFAMHVL